MFQLTFHSRFVLILEFLFKLSMFKSSQSKYYSPFLFWIPASKLFRFPEDPFCIFWLWVLRELVWMDWFSHDSLLFFSFRVEVALSLTPIWHLIPRSNLVASLQIFSQRPPISPYLHNALTGRKPSLNGGTTCQIALPPRFIQICLSLFQPRLHWESSNWC